MKTLAAELKNGNEVKYGNDICTIISVNEVYSTEKVICFNALIQAGTVKRRCSIYKNYTHESSESQIYFRKSTMVEVRN